MFRGNIGPPVDSRCPVALRHATRCAYERGLATTREPLASWRGFPEIFSRYVVWLSNRQAAAIREIVFQSFPVRENAYRSDGETPFKWRRQMHDSREVLETIRKYFSELSTSTPSCHPSTERMSLKNCVHLFLSFYNEPQRINCRILRCLAQHTWWQERGFFCV